MMSITIETTVNADIGDVWTAWTSPEDIKRWNAASEDWHTTHAEVDLRPGGEFIARMEAKDGSFGFDFKGTYQTVEENRLIEYSLEDGRKVRVEFEVTDSGVRVTETFDEETENPIEMQRDGWQSILNSFARHVESKR